MQTIVYDSIPAIPLPTIYDYAILNPKYNISSTYLIYGE
jgi:hypothetical protein